MPALTTKSAFLAADAPIALLKSVKSGIFSNVVIQEMSVLGGAMVVRFATLIVVGCLLSLVQMLGTSSKAMAADALFSGPLITGTIDETRLVRLANNVPRAFSAENDRGVVADDFPLEHLQLQLKRSPAQELAVDALIDVLHDPRSPGLAPTEVDIGWRQPMLS